jgi:predicted PurR-regulated permease PerM
MERERIVQVFFFGFLALMAYELFQLLSPFLVPIAWAILLGFIAYPAQFELNRLLRSRTTSALIITILVSLGVVLPAIWLSGRLAVEAQRIYLAIAEIVKNGGLKDLDNWINSSHLGGLFHRLSGRHFRVEEALPSLLQGAQLTSEFVVANVTSAAKNIVTFLIDATLGLVTFFYVLRDGEAYYLAIQNLTPLHDEDKRAVFDSLRGTMSAVLRGLLLTALIQGIAIGLGFLVTGLPYWAFLAVVSAACGLLPVGGTAIVWLPAALYLWYASGWPIALGLAIWCTVVVLVTDNFIKPMMMGQGTGLPTVALFFGIAGGLEVYGIVGVFAGPAVIALFAALLQVYRRTYGDESRVRAAGGS